MLRYPRYFDAKQTLKGQPQLTEAIFDGITVIGKANKHHQRIPVLTRVGFRCPYTKKESSRGFAPMLVEYHGQHRVDEDRPFVRGYHVQLRVAVSDG